MYGSFLAKAQRSRVLHHAKEITLADSFPKQWSFVIDESRAIALMCSRRAGKTDGLKIRTAFRAIANSSHRTLYIHHTRMLGKQQFFEPYREFLKSKGIEEESHDKTELWVKLKNGSLTQVVGCDDIKDVGRKLGYRWDDIIIDECQEFSNEILTSLVDKTILPTLIDRAGSITLSGTPPHQEAGLWWDTVTKESENPFKPIRWTLLDNPFIERQKIIDTMKLRGFTIDFENPTNNAVLIQREIFGLAIVDPQTMMYCYRAGENNWPVQGPPLIDSPQWRYAMGVDIGGARVGNDKDALVVLGWMIDDPLHQLWERESWEARQDSEAFCARVLDSFNRWRPMSSICADTGGAGANKMLEHLKPRLGGLEFTLKPTSVETSTRLLNDEFRSGRLKINPIGLIARDAKICTNPESYHSDIMAALRYAHHGAYNFLSKAPLSLVETDDQRRKRQWIQKQAKRANPWKSVGWRL